MKRLIARASALRGRGKLLLGALVAATSGAFVTPDVNAGSVVVPEHSVARQWNEALLHSIRNDLARPTVHARNLFHTAAVMWDSWAAYDATADQYLVFEKATAADVQAAREETMSYACYRLLTHRFENSVGSAEALATFDDLMGPSGLGYDLDNDSLIGDTPAALGNRIGQAMIDYGLSDNANEINDYANQHYAPINPPLVPDLPGNPDLIDPNRWQTLSLLFFVDQSGNVIPFGYPDALSPEWGQVKPFSMTEDDLTIYNRDGFDYWVYHDPGPPPYWAPGGGDPYYKWGFEMVATWSSHLDPADGVMIDISPGGIGNSPLPNPEDYELYYDKLNGGDWGPGHDLNPVTGMPYDTQIVPRGDYARVLAEFWADGPDSETPPGHWFTILNYVSDHPLFEKRFNGQGPILPDLEWDVKAYLCLGGAMHDAAVSAWGVKGWYDYIRPVSALRYLCDLGQCTDPLAANFHPGGVNLEPGYIELVTTASAAPGERHEHLAASVGKVAIKAWKGPDFISDPDDDVAGVDWILAENWWPYQRPTFVTPPFPGYVSGHSTFSRAASELMTLLTGDPFFPGGMGEFHCPQNEFLVFEDGPSVDLTLQWATYRDASDQTSLSRIWGGIHPPADDIPGRWMGEVIGPEAFHYAEAYFDGVACRGDATGDGVCNFDDLNILLDQWGATSGAGDVNHDGLVDFNDLNEVLEFWGESCAP